MVRLRERIAHRAIKLGRPDDGGSRRIVDHVAVILRREQRVERHRHDAGLDGAPEDEEEFRAVLHHHQQPVAGPDAEPFQGVAVPVYPDGQLPVADLFARRRQDGGLGAAAFPYVPVDEGHGGVERRREIEGGAVSAVRSDGDGVGSHRTAPRYRLRCRGRAANCIAQPGFPGSSTGTSSVSPRNTARPQSFRSPTRRQHARRQHVYACRRSRPSVRPPLASAGRRDDLRHGRARRADPADRIRSVDDRVAAPVRLAAADERLRLAAAVRPLQGDAAVPAGLPRPDRRRLQGDLLAGISAPAVRPVDRRRVPGRLRHSAAAPPPAAPAGPGAGRAVRPRRPAGRARLVHGRQRPGRPARGQPLPARRPPLAGDHPLRLDRLADRPHGPAGNADRRRGGRRRPAGVRRLRRGRADDRVRRLRRRPRRRQNPQHVSADGRRAGAGGLSAAGRRLRRTRRQSGCGAVQPSGAGDPDRPARPCPVVADARAGRRG